MEGNRKTGFSCFDDLMKDERYRKAYESDKRFFEGFRTGCAWGRRDALAEIEELEEDCFEEGWACGYGEGFSAGCSGLFTDGDARTDKPTDEESLLEFLDTLSLAEQRAALVHLSVKWAETEEKKKNERE